MKIVLLVVGPLFIAVGLFWFGQGTGLFSGPHNAVLIDARRGRRSLRHRPCLVRIAVAGAKNRAGNLRVQCELPLSDRAGVSDAGKLPR